MLLNELFTSLVGHLVMGVFMEQHKPHVIPKRRGRVEQLRSISSGSGHARGLHLGLILAMVPNISLRY